MIRLMLSVAAFVLLAGPVASQADDLELPDFVISGGNLPAEIRLPPPEADAFRRRINLPPRMEETPEVSGVSYEVTSSYWDDAVRREEEGEDEMDVDPTAVYYPNGGYVQAQLGDEEVWMVIDLRQRAVVDRTIRLAEQGAIGPNPSSIDVISAAMRDEMVHVEAGGARVAPETALAIFEELAATNPQPFVEPRTPVAADGSGFWLVVTLPEGRALQYYYDGSVLYEALGTERYDASTVSDLLVGLAPETPLMIEQQEPIGSLWWWPATIGGGLVLIGLAVWFRRRYPAA